MSSFAWRSSLLGDRGFVTHSHLHFETLLQFWVTAQSAGLRRRGGLVVLRLCGAPALVGSGLGILGHCV